MMNLRLITEKKYLSKNYLNQLTKDQDQKKIIKIWNETVNIL